MAEVFKRLSFRKTPSRQISKKDFDEATEGMSEEEIRSFHEKMAKMNQVLENELEELEEQKTMLANISNSGDLGTFDETRPSLKNMKRKVRRNSGEETPRTPESIIQSLQEALEDKKFELSTLKKENDGLKYLKENYQERMRLYEDSLRTTESSLQAVSEQLREAFEELGKKSLRIQDVERENRELHGKKWSNESHGTSLEDELSALKAHVASLEKKNRQQQLALTQIQDFDMPSARNKIGLLERQLAEKTKENDHFKRVECPALRTRILGLESELTNQMVHNLPQRQRTASMDSWVGERKGSKEIRIPLDTRTPDEARRGSAESPQRDLNEVSVKSVLGKKVDDEEEDIPCDEVSATANKVPWPNAEEEDHAFTSMPSPMINPNFVPKPILRPEGKQTGHSRKIHFDLKVILLDAALEGDLERTMYCLDNGAGVNSSNEEGLTALHSSSCNGHGPIVKFLIESGADVNAVDDDLWTPLHGAACFGEVAVTRYLVVHGANINAVNENNDTPLAVAVEEATKKYLQDCARNLTSAKEVYALYDHLAEDPDELSFQRGDKLTISTPPSDRETELWWAATNGHNKSGLVPFNFFSEYSPIPGVTAEV